MVNGKLTKAEKRRRAQQSARDRSSRTQNNNRGNSMTTVQTHTVITMSTATPEVNSGKEDNMKGQIGWWTINPILFPAMRSVLNTAVSYRIKSAQAYLIPTLPDSKPCILGLLVTPEEWNVKSLSDLQTCGGTVQKSTVSKISSNTIGAETEWRKTSSASPYRIYWGCSATEKLPLGVLEVRVVIETRGVAVLEMKLPVTQD